MVQVYLLALTTARWILKNMDGLYSRAINMRMHLATACQRGGTAASSAIDGLSQLTVTMPYYVAFVLHFYFIRSTSLRLAIGNCLGVESVQVCNSQLKGRKISAP
jgi:hypothetical protein